MSQTQQTQSTTDQEPIDGLLMPEDHLDTEPVVETDDIDSMTGQGWGHDSVTDAWAALGGWGDVVWEDDVQDKGFGPEFVSCIPSAKEFDQKIKALTSGMRPKGLKTIQSNIQAYHTAREGASDYAPADEIAVFIPPIVAEIKTWLETESAKLSKDKGIKRREYVEGVEVRCEDELSALYEGVKGDDLLSEGTRGRDDRGGAEFRSLEHALNTYDQACDGDVDYAIIEGSGKQALTEIQACMELDFVKQDPQQTGRLLALKGKVEQDLADYKVEWFDNYVLNYTTENGGPSYNPHNPLDIDYRDQTLDVDPTDAEDIEALVRQIEAKTHNISIEASSTEERYLILRDLFTLMSVPSGLKLINEISKACTIKIGSPACSPKNLKDAYYNQTQQIPGSGSACTVTYTLNDDGNIYDPDSWNQRRPNCIVLAHELSHAWAVTKGLLLGRDGAKMDDAETAVKNLSTQRTSDSISRAHEALDMLESTDDTDMRHSLVKYRIYDVQRHIQKYQRQFQSGTAGQSVRTLSTYTTTALTHLSTLDLNTIFADCNDPAPLRAQLNLVNSRLTTLQAELVRIAPLLDEKKENHGGKQVLVEELANTGLPCTLPAGYPERLTTENNFRASFGLPRRAQY